MTVQDLHRVLGHYLDFKKCSDLWSLISPPPGGPVSVMWQTPVNGSWLSKVAGLLYDLVGLAPNNTKLLSSKVVKALRVLLERNQLELCPRQGNTQDILDRMDLTMLMYSDKLKYSRFDILVSQLVLRILNDALLMHF